MYVLARLSDNNLVWTVLGTLWLVCTTTLLSVFFVYRGVDSYFEHELKQTEAKERASLIRDLAEKGRNSQEIAACLSLLAKKNIAKEDGVVVKHEVGVETKVNREPLMMLACQGRSAEDIEKLLLLCGKNEEYVNEIMTLATQGRTEEDIIRVLDIVKSHKKGTRP